MADGVLRVAAWMLLVAEQCWIVVLGLIGGLDGFDRSQDFGGD